MQFQDDQRWPSESWFRRWMLTPITTPNLTEYKLGLRFEAIMAHWIDREPSLTLLAKNQAVHDGVRTIGEFDLIVENDGTVEHWELAVKFYLGTGDVSDLDNWHGPDPSDTLARKINRMTSHQLRLSRHPAGLKLLEQNFKIGFKKTNFLSSRSKTYSEPSPLGEEREGKSHSE